MIDRKNHRKLRFDCNAAAGTPNTAWPTRTSTASRAEIIYPTVGMLLCNHRTSTYKKACFEAYNRWLADYCAEAPGPPPSAWPRSPCASPEDGVAELKAVKAMGFKGVMMPGDPAVEDYDSKIYDPVWATRWTGPAAQLPHPDHQVGARWRRTRAARASTASCRSSAAARTSWER
jgi:hypothetical protein